MSLEVWESVIDLCKYGDFPDISIGGGEPTLHPFFWRIICDSIGTFEHPWLATNGSVTKTSITLANMAKKGVIGCALSQDDYHDTIDEKVIHAFTHEKPKYQSPSSKDSREIRNVTGEESNAGRWQGQGERVCPCDCILVKPNGDVLSCACEDAICFGNVLTNVTIPENWDQEACTHDQEVKEWRLVEL